MKLIYILNRSSAFLLGLLLHACNTAQFTAEEAISFPESIKINQIQVLGTHNSYALPLDTAVSNYIDPIFEQLMGQYFEKMPEDQREKFEEYHPNKVKMSEGLSYDHPDFNEQLDSGLRSFEIDVYYDPTGNRFSKPAIYSTLRTMGKTDLLPYDSVGLEKPGFKVLHIPDIDFRTHYTTFEQALTALKNWSEKHPSHVPIFIMIEAKDKGKPIFPNSAEVLPYTAEVFDELDKLVFSVLGKEKVITPDVVRGKYPTLEEGVLAHNWPRLSESLGKFVFMLLPSTAGMSLNSPYVENRPNLEGRAMFVQSEPGQDHAAFLLLDNSILRKEEIRAFVEKGYLVRTRSDIETYEAKVNDMTRANAAFESGAQVISTDFFKPGNNYGTDYFVQLPNKKPVRVNPVNGNLK
ncbi:Ca2+-dependent phosphoinositide-specific phospholipase C [Flammeovirgaceae bacterium SG7u.111]|nr:Ca2+-dependent phosphoinositide-specific phospholipase C [Flammeovirgaceae bacterium SG7u.132]WPO34421.1 Ca2+-dependent phosphoinositide-specific phospholipase C [Flammeovirgaceae bacterium SG7u.111]